MAYAYDTFFFDGMLVGWHAHNAGPLSSRGATQKMEKMTHKLLGTCNSFASIGAAPSKAWTREDYLREFQALTAKMLDITTKKNNDYGGASDPFKNFRAFEELGILVRMSDKFARLKTALVEKREFQVADESLEDTAIDLANYALLLICYRRGA